MLIGKVVGTSGREELFVKNGYEKNVQTTPNAHGMTPEKLILVELA